MNIYCTLFDSNYLDKGLVLYRSLCRCEEDFRLYVFAFDDRGRDILLAENLEHMVVVSLEEFETPELLKVKTERTRAEYCWTCTPWTILHVLNQYHEPECTYIDADMMFFSSPSYIFADMKAKGCSVLITPHRFGNTKKEKKIQEHAGSYCVQFNTFLNDENGRKALDWWADQCLEWCFYASWRSGEKRLGDQKYLEEFEKRFDGVYVCEDYGAGIAPWNAGQLVLAENTPSSVKVKNTGKVYPIVFCHYAAITHLTRNYINVGSGITDPALHEVLYDRYVEEIIKARAYLKKQYGLELYVRRQVGKNIFIAFYHKFISPICKIRRLSDIYKI